MTPTRQGSIRLFRFAGIDLYLHWSWFLVGAYEVTARAKGYTSLTWNVLEYLALFLIVLLHEFGHALACRQVGGRANQIVLWPLGGVAYVDPPPRPGATLWSIAAGPLVNVALIPILLVLVLLGRSWGWAETMPNAQALLQTVGYINLGLLIFNLLPIYPLDGGQILRSLLWYGLGRASSLMVASVIGLAGVVVLMAFAYFWLKSIWITIVGVFIFMNCWRGLQHARELSRTDRAPRHDGFACPACKTAPPRGDFWICGNCRKSLDLFQTQAICPHCGVQFAAARCLDCGGSAPIHDWFLATPALPKL
jgi:Zn-dependent protease